MRVLFSGDLGSDLSPVLAGPRPAPNADAVFIEATYGATRRDEGIGREREQFRQLVGKALERGGVVWIPCFALDRTQRILYELRLAQQENRLPQSLPIYCPSPTAKEVTAIYRQNRRAGWFRPAVAADADAFSPSEILTTVPSHGNLPRPSIVISTSDITYTAWMRTLLRSLLPEASTTVILVGYGDPDTAAGRLKAISLRLPPRCTHSAAFQATATRPTSTVGSATSPRPPRSSCSTPGRTNSTPAPPSFANSVAETSTSPNLESPSISQP